jgi:hypothetical protein
MIKKTTSLILSADDSVTLREQLAQALPQLNRVEELYGMMGDVKKQLTVHRFERLAAQASTLLFPISNVSFIGLP